jgi:hypothetical protein
MDSFLAMQKLYFENPSFAGWGSCLPLLFGPLLLLYTQSVLYQEFSLTGKRWIHFLPFIVCFLITETGYLLQSGEMKLTIWNGRCGVKIKYSVTMKAAGEIIIDKRIDCNPLLNTNTG